MADKNRQVEEVTMFSTIRNAALVALCATLASGTVAGATISHFSGSCDDPCGPTATGVLTLKNNYIPGNPIRPLLHLVLV
jgi:hypothetical protein